MMARKIPNAAFMAEGHSRARASVISTSVILHTGARAVRAGPTTDIEVAHPHQSATRVNPQKPIG
jgi:hypothetical protein